MVEVLRTGCRLSFLCFALYSIFFPSLFLKWLFSAPPLLSFHVLSSFPCVDRVTGSGMNPDASPRPPSSPLPSLPNRPPDRFFKKSSSLSFFPPFQSGGERRPEHRPFLSTTPPLFRAGYRFFLIFPVFKCILYSTPPPPLPGEVPPPPLQ